MGRLFQFLLPIFPTYCVIVLTLSLGVQISYQNLQTRPFQHRKNAVVKMRADRISWDLGLSKVLIRESHRQTGWRRQGQ